MYYISLEIISEFGVSHHMHMMSLALHTIEDYTLDYTPSYYYDTHFEDYIHARIYTMP